MKLGKVNLLAGLAMVALFLALTPKASAQDVRLESRFTNTGEDPLASGHARYDQRGGNRHLRVQVEDVFTTDWVIVYLSDPTGTDFIFVGDIVIDPALGFGGEIDLHTTDGAEVPVVGQGDIVWVFSAYEPWPLLLYGDLQPRP